MDVFEKITRIAQTIIDVAIIDTDSNTQVILTCAKDIIEIAKAGNAHLMNAEPSSLNMTTAITATSSGNCEIDTMNTALVSIPLGETKSNDSLADPSLKEIFRKCIKEELQDPASFADPSLKEVFRKCIKEELQDLNLIPPKPMPPQVSPEDKLPYTLIVEKKDPNDINIQDLWYIEYTFNKTDYAPLCERQLTTDELRIDFETIHQRRRVFREILETETLDKKFKCLEADRIVIVVVRGISKSYGPAILRTLIYNCNPEVLDKKNPKEEAILTVESIGDDQNSYMALLAVSLRGWHALITLGKLNIGYIKCPVEDYVSVKQCNYCLQYGHSRRGCTQNVPICSHCASIGHNYHNCKVKNDKENMCCYNCKTNPIKLRRPYKHSATSSLCPHWKLACERVRLLTKNFVRPALYRPSGSE